MALEAVPHLRSPEDRLLSEVLAIVMDEGLYCEVRVLAAKALSALLTENAAHYQRDGRAVVCGVVQKIRMLLDSPQLPVMHKALRECLAAMDGDGNGSRLQLMSHSQ